MLKTNRDNLAAFHGGREPDTIGVSALAAGGRRAQRTLALLMVLLPALGVVAAAALVRLGHKPTFTDLLLFATFFVVTALGVEVGFHRYFSHVAFKAKPLVRAGLALAGSMAAQGPLIFWAATHRRHHAFSDRPGDPHSPYFDETCRPSLQGLWHAHVGWLFVHELTDWSRYAPDLARDRRLIRINQSYLWWIVLGLLLPAVIDFCVVGTWWAALNGLLYGGLIRIFVLHHTTWAVNSLCHVMGSRPYVVRDRSANNAFLALPSMGGSWHNTHHAFPSLAKNNVFWWQIDLSGSFVTLLERLGLAWDVHAPTAKMQLAARTRRTREASRSTPEDMQ